jgi:hypothetical protein
VVLLDCRAYAVSTVNANPRRSKEMITSVVSNLVFFRVADENPITYRVIVFQHNEEGYKSVQNILESKRIGNVIDQVFLENVHPEFSVTLPKDFAEDLVKSTLSADEKRALIKMAKICTGFKPYSWKEAVYLMINPNEEEVQ